MAERDPAAALEFPPLVWVAAPDVVSGARLSADLASLEFSAGSLRASLVPKIALNRSYFDASSAEFFRGRTIKVRGRIADGAIAMRTLWPEDFRIDRAPPRLSLAADMSTGLALRALMRAEPRAVREAPSLHRPCGSATRRGTRRRQDVPCSESWSTARRATTTRRTRATSRSSRDGPEDGAIGDWLVNNFYALDSESEKGILAAPVPLDNYLADLNSGQGWYRPSQMLVLVLADDRAAALVQAALNRVYNQFWRHQLAYRHASMNCAGISVDVLRVAGLGYSAAWSGRTDRRGTRLSVCRGQGAFPCQGARHLRLPDRGSDPAPARRRIRGMRRRCPGVGERWHG